MAKVTRIVLVATALLPALCLMPRYAAAIEQNSPACKRELLETRKKMAESLTVIDRGKNASAEEKCKAYSQAFNLVEDIRESFARCEPAQSRTSAVRDADEVYDATQKAYENACPPRSGMMRVHMTNVTHVTRDKLPKPLAAAHTCSDGPMFFTNERFDLGRLVVLGCPGSVNPSAEEMKKRNAKAELLKGEQAMVYITRDRDGDDPQRLSFPILAADGSEVTTDLLFASRIFIGDKIDRISSFWEPAKEGVCRINAVWQVADGKAKLVLWREATDCAAGKNTEFKVVVDRLAQAGGAPGDEMLGTWDNIRPGHPSYTLSRDGDNFRLTNTNGSGSIDGGKFINGSLFFDAPRGRLEASYMKSRDQLTIGGQIYRRAK